MPGFHQVFTRSSPSFGNSPRLSSSFHQVLEIHQVFTRFSIFSPSLDDNQEVSESRQVSTVVMVASVLYSLFNAQNASLE